MDLEKVRRGGTRTRNPAMKSGNFRTSAHGIAGARGVESSFLLYRLSYPPRVVDGVGIEPTVPEG